MLVSLMLLLPVIVSAVSPRLSLERSPSAPAPVRRRRAPCPPSLTRMASVPLSGEGPAPPPIEQDKLPEYVIKTWSTVLWSQRAGGAPATSALAGAGLEPVPGAQFHAYNPYEPINATPPPPDSVKGAVASLADCVDLCNANDGVVPTPDKCSGSGSSREEEDPECYCKKNAKVWRRRATKCWRQDAPLIVYKNQDSAEECPADMDLPLTLRYVAEGNTPVVERGDSPNHWLQLEEEGQRLRMQLFSDGAVKSVTGAIQPGVDRMEEEGLLYDVVEDTQTVFAGHSEGGGWSWAAANKLLEKASPHPAPVHIITTGTLTIDPTFTEPIYEQIRASGGSVTNYILGVRVKKEDVRSFDEWGTKVVGDPQTMRERIFDKNSEQTGDYIDLVDLKAYDSNATNAMLFEDSDDEGTSTPDENFYPYPTFFMCEWEGGRFTTCLDDGDSSVVGKPLFQQIETPDYKPNPAMDNSYKSLPSVNAPKDIPLAPALTKDWIHRFDTYRACLQLCFDKFRSTFSGSSSEGSSRSGSRSVGSRSGSTSPPEGGRSPAVAGTLLNNFFGAVAVDMHDVGPAVVNTTGTDGPEVEELD